MNKPYTVTYKGRRFTLWGEQAAKRFAERYGVRPELDRAKLRQINRL